jgi:HD-GYP domain-containing protein (c-di-GMP phosphodiesterase class II)
MNPVLDEQRRFEDLRQQAQHLLLNDPTAALEVARNALQMAQSGEPQQLVFAEHLIGQCLYRLSMLEASFEHLERAAAALEHDGCDTVHLIDVLIDMARTVRDLGRTELAQQHLDRAIHMAQTWGQVTLEAKALSLMASCCSRNGQTDRALQLLLRALALQELQADAVGQANTLNNLGIVYTTLGEPVRALEFLFRCHRQLPTDDGLRFYCLTNIGNALQALDRNLEALEHFLRALDAADQHFGNIILGRINVAFAYLALERLEEAEHELLEVRNLSEQAGLIRHLGLATLQLAEIHLRRNNAKAAVEGFNTAHQLCQQSEDIESQVEALIGLGKAHRARKEHPRAVNALERAFELSQRALFKRHSSQIHLLLSETHESILQSDLALEHLKEHVRLQQELFNENSDRRARVLTIEFETEKAQHEAATYRKQSELVAELNASLEQRVQERTEALEQAQLEMLERLATAAEYRDDDTGQHTFRVGQMSARIAAKLGWDAPRVALLKLAARLHDVGKIGIPDTVLLKPGKFTPPEFELMKSHAEIGGGILAGGHSPLIQMAESIAHSHHERWDGNGYPHKLTGENIPLEGRIVSVADVFDALTSERPYKTAWTRQAALEEIQSKAGSQFDPTVVQAFLVVMED